MSLIKFYQTSDKWNINRCCIKKNFMFMKFLCNTIRKMNYSSMWCMWNYERHTLIYKVLFKIIFWIVNYYMSTCYLNYRGGKIRIFFVSAPVVFIWLFFKVFEDIFRFYGFYNQRYIFFYSDFRCYDYCRLFDEF